MVLYREERYGESATALAELYSPPMRSTAHEVGERCRSGEIEPWDFPPAYALDRASMDPRSAVKQDIFLLEVFCTLSSAYCVSGDGADAFDLAALLANMRPQAIGALSVYADACRQLGLENSAQQALRRLSGAGLAAPAPPAGAGR